MKSVVLRNLLFQLFVLYDSLDGLILPPRQANDPGESQGQAIDPTIQGQGHVYIHDTLQYPDVIHKQQLNELKPTHLLPPEPNTVDTSRDPYEIIRTRRASDTGSQLSPFSSSSAIPGTQKFHSTNYFPYYTYPQTPLRQRGGEEENHAQQRATNNAKIQNREEEHHNILQGKGDLQQALRYIGQGRSYGNNQNLLAYTKSPFMSSHSSTSDEQGQQNMRRRFHGRKRRDVMVAQRSHNEEGQLARSKDSAVRRLMTLLDSRDILRVGNRIRGYIEDINLRNEPATGVSAQGDTASTRGTFRPNFESLKTAERNTGSATVDNSWIVDTPWTTVTNAGRGTVDAAVVNHGSYVDDVPTVNAGSPIDDRPRLSYRNFVDNRPTGDGIIEDRPTAIDGSDVDVIPTVNGIIDEKPSVNYGYIDERPTANYGYIDDDVNFKGSVSNRPTSNHGGYSDGRPSVNAVGYIDDIPSVNGKDIIDHRPTVNIGSDFDSRRIASYGHHFDSRPSINIRGFVDEIPTVQYGDNIEDLNQRRIVENIPTSIGRNTVDDRRTKDRTVTGYIEDVPTPTRSSSTPLPTSTPEFGRSTRNSESSIVGSSTDVLNLNPLNSYRMYFDSDRDSRLSSYVNTLAASGRVMDSDKSVLDSNSFNPFYAQRFYRVTRDLDSFNPSYNQEAFRDISDINSFNPFHTKTALRYTHASSNVNPWYDIASGANSKRNVPVADQPNPGYTMSYPSVSLPGIPGVLTQSLGVLRQFVSPLLLNIGTVLPAMLYNDPSSSKDVAIQYNVPSHPKDVAMQYNDPSSSNDIAVQYNVPAYPKVVAMLQNDPNYSKGVRSLFASNIPTPSKVFDHLYPDNIPTNAENIGSIFPDTMGATQDYSNNLLDLADFPAFPGFDRTYVRQHPTRVTWRPRSSRYGNIHRKVGMMAGEEEPLEIRTIGGREFLKSSFSDDSIPGPYFPGHPILLQTGDASTEESGYPISERNPRILPETLQDRPEPSIVPEERHIDRAHQTIVPRENLLDSPGPRILAGGRLFDISDPSILPRERLQGRSDLSIIPERRLHDLPTPLHSGQPLPRIRRDTAAAVLRSSHHGNSHHGHHGPAHHGGQGNQGNGVNVNGNQGDIQNGNQENTQVGPQVPEVDGLLSNQGNNPNVAQVDGSANNLGGAVDLTPGNAGNVPLDAVHTNIPATVSGNQGTLDTVHTNIPTTVPGNQGTLDTVHTNVPVTVQGKQTPVYPAPNDTPVIAQGNVGTLDTAPNGTPVTAQDKQTPVYTAPNGTPVIVKGNQGNQGPVHTAPNGTPVTALGNQDNAMDDTPDIGPNGQRITGGLDDFTDTLPANLDKPTPGNQDFQTNIAAGPSWGGVQDYQVDFPVNAGTGLQGYPDYQTDLGVTGVQGDPYYQTDLAMTGVQGSPYYQTDLAMTGVQGYPIYQTDSAVTGVQGNLNYQTDSAMNGMQGNSNYQTDLPMTGVQSNSNYQTTGIQGNQDYQTGFLGMLDYPNEAGQIVPGLAMNQRREVEEENNVNPRVNVGVNNQDFLNPQSGALPLQDDRK